MHPDLTIRAAVPADYDRIVGVVDAWWGRPISGALPRVFLDHFFGTSLVAERRAGVSGPQLVGFLVGFGSPADPSQGYIHFVGVDPDERCGGLARALYERFLGLMRADGRTVVHAVTSPVNTGSIAFHRAMGFELEGPVAGYDGPAADRVVFTLAPT